MVQDRAILTMVDRHLSNGEWETIRRSIDNHTIDHIIQCHMRKQSGSGI